MGSISTSKLYPQGLQTTSLGSSLGVRGIHTSGTVHSKEKAYRVPGNKIGIFGGELLGEV